MLYPQQVPISPVVMNSVPCHPSLPSLARCPHYVRDERVTHHGYAPLHQGPVSYHATSGLAAFSIRQKFKLSNMTPCAP